MKSRPELHWVFRIAEDQPVREVNLSGVLHENALLPDPPEGEVIDAGAQLVPCSAEEFEQTTIVAQVVPDLDPHRGIICGEPRNLLCSDITNVDLVLRAVALGE